ncbi:VCBS repeat-containing protein, partial [bacterium]|nr:VCBS repeat-containing protein [bacterium]
GDIDGDGRAELATTYGSVFRWLAPGTWSNVANLGLSLTADKLYGGDVDGDGLGDFIVQAAHQVQVYRATGTATFCLLGTIQRGSVTPGTLAPEEIIRTGDLDGDGDDELFLRDGTIRVFEYQAGTMVEVFPAGATTAVDAVELADLNADGIPDWIAVTSNIIGVHQGLGGNPPAFAIPSVTAWPTTGTLSSPRVADVDGDGQPDLIMVHRVPIPFTLPSVSQIVTLVVAKGVPGGFSTLDIGPKDVTAMVDANPFFQLGDVNGDGRPDLVDRSGGLGPIVSCPRPLHSLALSGTATADTLFLDGSSGGVARVVPLALSPPFTILVTAPPAATGPLAFALWGQFGALNLLDHFEGPFGAGAFTPDFLLPGRPGAFTVTNGLWADPRALAPSGPTPWTQVVPGPPIPVVFSLQGLIVDTGVVPPAVFVTNAVTADLR